MRRKTILEKRETLLKRPILLIMALLLAGFAAGPGAAGGNMKEAAVVATKQDNGKEIVVRAGDAIEVQLEAQGGTGYWWYTQDLDTRHLELFSEKTRAASDGRVGGPVLGIWSFRAREPGVSAIKMAYYRTWEGSGNATDHFSIRVRIE